MGYSAITVSGSDVSHHRESRATATGYERVIQQEQIGMVQSQEKVLTAGVKRSTVQTENIARELEARKGMKNMNA